MSDQDVREIKGDLQYLRGRLDATLPNLATRADVMEAIDAHAAACSKGSSKQLALLVGTIVTLCGGLIAVINWLIK